MIATPTASADQEQRDIATPADARALIGDVRSAAAVLCDLIDTETQLISAGRAHEIESLQGDKAELSAAYLWEMTRLKRNAEAVRAFAADELDELRPLLQELGAKLLRNQNALAAILSVSERLIRSGGAQSRRRRQRAGNLWYRRRGSSRSRLQSGDLARPPILSTIFTEYVSTATTGINVELEPACHGVGMLRMGIKSLTTS